MSATCSTVRERVCGSWAYWLGSWSLYSLFRLTGNWPVLVIHMKDESLSLCLYMCLVNPALGVFLGMAQGFHRDSTDI